MVDVLGCLLGAGEAVWGLSISAATGRPTGTVYPLLVRLEQASVVTSDWEPANDRPGPRRRFYALTPAGCDWASGVCAARQPARSSRPALRVVVA
ncbi:helix-turn-helix transcriptional regulator [Sanguibacter antarcticus]|nr:helix-turn-helix transcriptional regulator [Sanguibacter antarcticus]